MKKRKTKKEKQKNVSNQVIFNKNKTFHHIYQVFSCGIPALGSFLTLNRGLKARLKRGSCFVPKLQKILNKKKKKKKVWKRTFLVFPLEAGGNGGGDMSERRREKRSYLL